MLSTSSVVSEDAVVTCADSEASVKRRADLIKKYRKQGMSLEEAERAASEQMMKEDVDCQMGIEDQKTVHVVKASSGGTPRDWTYRVESPRSPKNPEKPAFTNTLVVVKSGLKPNPVRLDGRGISEYLPKETASYLVECGYTKYMEAK